MYKKNYLGVKVNLLDRTALGVEAMLVNFMMVIKNRCIAHAVAIV